MTIILILANNLVESIFKITIKLNKKLGFTRKHIELKVL